MLNQPSLLFNSQYKILPLFLRLAYFKFILSLSLSPNLPLPLLLPLFLSPTPSWERRKQYLNGFPIDSRQQLGSYLVYFSGFFYITWKICTAYSLDSKTDESFSFSFSFYFMFFCAVPKLCFLFYWLVIFMLAHLTYPSYYKTNTNFSHPRIQKSAYFPLPS